ncbi:uncharacterized protein METZ01_LOCUS496043, partial [marine metagenome]
VNIKSIIVFIYDFKYGASELETMDEEIMEFGIAHNRKYSRDHLWYQEKDDRLVIGISDYLGADIG